MRMFAKATQPELNKASKTVEGFVNTHSPKPYSNDFGEFLVCRATLEVPRVIGERTANFLRLFKGLRGDILAGASYSEAGLEPYPDTDVLREMPLRHVLIRADEPSTYAFNGGMDANEYPLPSFMVGELLEDLTVAH